jgi:XTP/dITP diphosphohydrolase
MDLWFATDNSHKREELEAILGRSLIIPRDRGLPFAPDENGAAFLDNALIKARALWRIVRAPVIADDSGLCVDALGGRPGIYSARYGGKEGSREQGPGNREFDAKVTETTGQSPGSQTDLLTENPVPAPRSPVPQSEPPFPVPRSLVPQKQRNRLLLSELGEAADRRARFVCAMALVTGEQRFFAAQECLEGEIGREERGEGGFGYDPLLYLPEYRCTVAELPADVKNRISHRALAGRAIARFLEGL